MIFLYVELDRLPESSAFLEKLEDYKEGHGKYGIVFGVLNLRMFLSVSDSREYLKKSGAC